jgi:hypothetical protein|nr:MAG TPA: hypothetical protein [Caudoviricetes sp.]
MNNQNGNYSGISSPPLYNMNLTNQNNGMTTASPLQQFSNYNQPSVKRVPARIINDPKEIMPNEVPMDGSVSLFPTADYSCVYAKAWNANGMIDTVKYVPEKPETQPTVQSQDVLTAILARLDNIERTLNKRNKPYNKPVPKKEVESNA